MPTDPASMRMLPDVRGLLMPLSTLTLFARYVRVEVVDSIPESELPYTVFATTCASTALCTSMP